MYRNHDVRLYKVFTRNCCAADQRIVNLQDNRIIIRNRETVSSKNNDCIPQNLILHGGSEQTHADKPKCCLFDRCPYMRVAAYLTVKGLETSPVLLTRALTSPSIYILDMFGV